MKQEGKNEAEFASQDLVRSLRSLHLLGVEGGGNAGDWQRT